MGFADPHELEGRLDHAEGRVSVAVEYPIGERSVIGPDPHRHPELLRALRKGAERLFETGELRVVLGVGVLADRELLAVGVVAGVHADLLDVLDGFHGGARGKVNVGDEGDAHLSSGERASDRGQAACVGRGRDGNADDLATGLDQTDYLGDGRLGVRGGGGGHGLHPDRVAAADPEVAHPHLAGRTPAVRVRGCAPSTVHRMGL